MALCLPWWHVHLSKPPTTTVSSGCSVSGGNVPCAPEQLRAAAETKMRASGWWPADKPLSLDAYSLGRYVTTEVGTRSVEEMVAVIEAAINKARQRKQSPSALLLTGKAGHQGYYGPIHLGTTAPYGRWAGSSKDPTMRSLVIADFVLSGQTKNFAKGANSQYGLDILMNRGRDPVDFVADQARDDRHYWVGPLPGVDHFHTFLVRTLSKTEASLLGPSLIAQAKSWVVRPKPDWSTLGVCPRPLSVAGLDGGRLALGVGLVAGLGLGLGRLGILGDLRRRIARR